MGGHGPLYGRLDVLHQGRDIPFQRTALALGGAGHGGDGAALGVAQHHQDRRVDMGQPVFDGPGFVGAAHVARDPDHKDVHDAGVEDPFHRHPGIRASDHRGVGMIPLVLIPRLHQPFEIGARVIGGAVDEPLVSFPEQLERLIRRWLGFAAEHLSSSFFSQTCRWMAIQ